MRPALATLAAGLTGAGPAPWTPTNPSTDPPGTPVDVDSPIPDPPDDDAAALRFQSGGRTQTVLIDAANPDWETDLQAAFTRSLALRTINQTAGDSPDYRMVAVFAAGTYVCATQWQPPAWCSIIGATGDPTDVIISSTVDAPEGGLIDGGTMALEAVTLTCPDTPTGTIEPPYGGPKYPIHWHGGGPFNLTHVILSNTNTTSHGSAVIGIDCEHTGDTPGLQMVDVTATTLHQWGVNSHNNVAGGVWTTRMKNCDFSQTASITFTTAQPDLDRWHAQNCTVPAWKITSSGADVTAQVLDTTTPITWTTI